MPPFSIPLLSQTSMSAPQWAAPSVLRDGSAGGHLVPGAVSADGRLTGALAVTGFRCQDSKGSSIYRTELVFLLLCPIGCLWSFLTSK